MRDLLIVARAVDDPTNTMHTLAALRTPLLACGDDDLFRFKVERRGRWSYRADQPDTVPDDDPVLAGLRYLRGLHDARHWLAPSELLDRIARERRVLELGFAEGRPRRVAASAFRHRPGPGMERCHRRQPAQLPALGRAADRRRGRGSRRRFPRRTTMPCGS